MNPKFLIFIIFVSIILMFLGATFELHNSSSTWEGETQVTTLEYLMDFKNATYKQTTTGEWTFVMINGEYFNTWLQVFTFDFTFFQGEWFEFIRWIFFIPIAIGVVWGFAYAFTQLLQGFIPFT